MIEVLVCKISFFSLIHSAYFICYISSNTANGLDELSGADNMEIEEGQGNRGLAVAATSKNGKHNSANILVDGSFILQPYAICA
jgi:hypothetical protein